MKALIVLQRKYAAMGNAIALELKNNHGVDEFCGYVVKRSSLDFINSQKDVKYTGLILDEDLHNKYKSEKLDIEYIKKLEAEYGTPNLWPNIIVDRTLMMNVPPREYVISPKPPFTHEEMLRILQARFRAVIDFLNKEKPDFIVGCVLGSAGTYILYHVAKKMGIRTYFPEEGRIGKRATFIEDYGYLTGVDKIFSDIRKNKIKNTRRQEALELLNNFRKAPAMYSIKLKKERKPIALLPGRMLKSAIFTIKSITSYIGSPYKSDITTENPFWALRNKIEKALRNLRNINYLYDKPDWNEDYAYFPLHTDPEIATMLYAPFFTNQITLLSQIAQSLPANFKLYVKEHPVMLLSRPTKYYKELKKIPNLKLIHPKTNTFDLTKNSKLITIISGTTGWEGLMLGKPVITFGKVFYNKLSMVKRCGALEDLPQLVKNQLENFKYDETELADFISAILEDTISFDFVDYWENKKYEEVKNHQPFKDFVGLLAKKIAENGKTPART